MKSASAAGIEQAISHEVGFSRRDSPALSRKTALAAEIRMLRNKQAFGGTWLSHAIQAMKRETASAAKGIYSMSENTLPPGALDRHGNNAAVDARNAAKSFVSGFTRPASVEALPTLQSKYRHLHENGPAIQKLIDEHGCPTFTTQWLRIQGSAYN